jgi:hypothetical protein
VGNISFDTDERSLDNAFGKYGKITDIFIPVKHGTRQPRGFAFVTFDDSRDAADAVAEVTNTLVRCSSHTPASLSIITYLPLPSLHRQTFSHSLFCSFVPFPLPYPVGRPHHRRQHRA